MIGRPARGYSVSALSPHKLPTTPFVRWQGGDTEYPFPAGLPIMLLIVIGDYSLRDRQTADDVICDVTGRRHKSIPFLADLPIMLPGSHWWLLTLSLRRRREAAFLFPESWWHLRRGALPHLISCLSRIQNAILTIRKRTNYHILKGITSLPRRYLHISMILLHDMVNRQVVAKIEDVSLRNRSAH